MKRVSLIRIATYGAFLAILVLSRRQLRVLPIALVGGEEVEAHDAATKRLSEDRKIFAALGFLDAKISGSELLSIAAATAKKNGQSCDGFAPPEIALRMVGGRLVWFLDYRELQFRITVDDISGVATFASTEAPR